MEKDYSQNLVTEYEHWQVYVNENQSFLGRLIIWCKRENATDLADATPEEQHELFVVLHDMREALKKAFEPDWFNYSFLGNGTPHLHCHLVSRYATPRTFAGVTYVDDRFGKSYRTNHDFETSPELRAAVRDQLKGVL